MSCRDGKLRIVYCGYDFYADCLEYLLSRDDVRVLKVFSCGKGSNKRFRQKVVSLAKQYRVPHTVRPISVRDVERFFSSEGCDYILSAGYSHKIPINAHRGLNVHPTLLPIGRGPWPFPKIILDGHTESGVTIHKLTDRFDEGDVVLQKRFPLDKDETQDTLLCKCQALGLEMIREWLEKPEDLWESAQPQGAGEYWKKLTAKDRTLRFDDSPEQIERMVRAFGAAGVFFNANGKTWVSAFPRYQTAAHSFAPGEVLSSNAGLFTIAVQNGFLYIANAFEKKKPGARKRRLRGLKLAARKIMAKFR